jgi:hypothetical protein
MRAVFFPVFLFLFACSSGSYRYAPDKDHAESTLAVPGGDLRVSSLGIVDVRPESHAPWTRSLHLRVLASNDSKTNPWVLRPENLTILLRGDKRLTPRFVNTEDAPAELRVAPGERRGFELYYPLQNSQLLDGFTFEWKLSAGGDPLRGSVAFQRIITPELRVVPGDPYYPYGPYYGPYGAGFWGPEVIRPAVPTRRYYSR